MRQSGSGRVFWVVGVLVAAIAGWVLWWASSQASEGASLSPASGAPSGAEIGREVQPVLLPVASSELTTNAVEPPVIHLPEAVLISPGRNVAIIVVDATGRPVPDALVEKWDSTASSVIDTQWLKDRVKGQVSTELMEALGKEYMYQRTDATWDAPITSVRTDAEGHCAIADVTNSTVLLASKDGLGTSGAWQATAVPEMLLLKLHDTATIHGIVTGVDGDPLPSATVRFCLLDGFNQGRRSRAPRPVRCDEHGAFSVTLDAPASGLARADTPAAVSIETVFLVEPGEDRRVDLAFAGGYSISGVVVTDSMDPIEGATVTAERASGDPDFDWHDFSAKTPANGTFKIDLVRPGAHSIDVVADGWASRHVETVELSNNEPHGEVVIRCEATATISGRVIWDDGEPIRGARVEARAQVGQDDMPVPDPSKCDGTDEDGSFRLMHVRQGHRYRLVAAAMRQAFVTVELGDVEPGASALVLELSRKDAEGVSLSARVVDMDSGAPVQRFSTYHSRWSSPGRFGLSVNGPTWHESDDGRFVLHRLPVGWSWAVEIQASDYEPAIFGPLHPMNETEFEFKIGRAGGLTVEVVDYGGRPIEGVTVALFNEVTCNGLDLTLAERTDITGADGQVAWRELAPGSRWVLAGHSSGRAGPVTAVVPSGALGTVQCRLSRDLATGSVQVLVLDVDGEPQPDAEVAVGLTEEMSMVLRAGGEDGPAVESAEYLSFTSVQTDAAGRGAAAGLIPGVYGVHVVGRSESPSFVIVAPGSTATVELRQRR